MNFLKNALSITILFTINSMDARQMGGVAPAPQPSAQPPVIKPVAPQPIPVVKPIPQQPTPATNKPIVPQPQAPQNQTYRNLVDYVKTAGNVWDNSRGMLRTDFVTSMVQKARMARLEDFQLEALLKTARDLHGIFSGNANKDIATLQTIDKQIATAIRK